jgi:hypothetical protein
MHQVPEAKEPLVVCLLALTPVKIPLRPLKKLLMMLRTSSVAEILPVTLERLSLLSSFVPKS